LPYGFRGAGPVKIIIIIIMLIMIMGGWIGGLVDCLTE
jgi:hypothetical protein